MLRLEVEAKDERAHDVFAAFDNDGSGAPWQLWGSSECWGMGPDGTKYVWCSTPFRHVGWSSYMIIKYLIHFGSRFKIDINWPDQHFFDGTNPCDPFWDMLIQKGHNPSTWKARKRCGGDWRLGVHQDTLPHCVQGHVQRARKERWRPWKCWWMKAGLRCTAESTDGLKGEFEVSAFTKNYRMMEEQPWHGGCVESTKLPEALPVLESESTANTHFVKAISMAHWLWDFQGLGRAQMRWYESILK